MTTFIKNTIFLKIQYSEPLNTFKKNFETFLLNLPVDERKIQGKYIGIDFLRSNGHNDGCLQS